MKPYIVRQWHHQLTHMKQLLSRKKVEIQNVKTSLFLDIRMSIIFAPFSQGKNVPLLWSYSESGEFEKCFFLMILQWVWIIWIFIASIVKANKQCQWNKFELYIHGTITSLNLTYLNSPLKTGHTCTCEGQPHTCSVLVSFSHCWWTIPLAIISFCFSLSLKFKGDLCLIVMGLRET